MPVCTEKYEITPIKKTVLKVSLPVIANGVKQSRALVFTGLLRAIALAMTLLPTFHTAL